MAYIIIGENSLVVRNYTYQSNKIKNDIKVVAISDLHNKEFGKNNINLINKIKEQNPDIITIIGDMNTETNPDYHVAIDLLNNIKDIAPVYYVLGNHEFDVENTSNIVSDIKATGVNLLDDKTENVKVGTDTITIGGITRFYFWDDNAVPTLKKLEASENVKILLCHYPEYYMWWFGKENTNIDIMISGHAHGGLIQIPFVGGLFAPEQGWFPKYYQGTYKYNNNEDIKCTLLVTTGLFRSSEVPRVNNPPEVLSLTIEAII